MLIASKISLPGDHQIESECFDRSLNRARHPLAGPGQPPLLDTLPYRAHRCLTSSVRGRDQVAHADQVVRRGGKREHPADSVSAAVVQLGQQYDRLAPPKDPLRAIALDLDDHVAMSESRRHRDLADAVALVRNKQVVGRVERHAGQVEELRRGGRPAVAAEPIGAIGPLLCRFLPTQVAELRLSY